MTPNTYVVPWSPRFVTVMVGSERSVLRNEPAGSAW